MIAAHYTVGTDLNPINAEHYASENFTLLNERAGELNLQVDNHYRVTDKLVQEMISFVRREKPDMLLLGAGSHYRPDMPGTPGAILWLSLFQDKIDEVLEQVKCPVAVFVNRNYREGALVSFVMGDDRFLLAVLSRKCAFGRPLG
ncbi:Na(+)/H(+) antiporter [Bacteroides reticulotermitis JCM 10512]|uniref:Na(+)/H(+) antiporter n=1 Tax=Bacteroides reticulotermitis JCM 10512 TaxID=1445607 RepID=W4US14_9BACE|nr:Na(+)/H(+) antiporter [Bacteroides reticulotermitis JCM 10512]